MSSPRCSLHRMNRSKQPFWHASSIKSQNKKLTSHYMYLSTNMGKFCKFLKATNNILTKLVIAYQFLSFYSFGLHGKSWHGGFLNKYPWLINWQCRFTMHLKLHSTLDEVTIVLCILLPTTHSAFGVITVAEIKKVWPINSNQFRHTSVTTVFQC